MRKRKGTSLDTLTTGMSCLYLALKFTRFLNCEQLQPATNDFFTALIATILGFLYAISGSFLEHLLICFLFFHLLRIRHSLGGVGKIDKVYDSMLRRFSSQSMSCFNVS